MDPCGPSFRSHPCILWKYGLDRHISSSPHPLPFDDSPLTLSFFLTLPQPTHLPLQLPVPECNPRLHQPVLRVHRPTDPNQHGWFILHPVSVGEVVARQCGQTSGCHDLNETCCCTSCTSCYPLQTLILTTQPTLGGPSSASPPHISLDLLPPFSQVLCPGHPALPGRRKLRCQLLLLSHRPGGHLRRTGAVSRGVDRRCGPEVGDMATA